MYLRTQFAARKQRGSAKMVEIWVASGAGHIGYDRSHHPTSVFLTSLASMGCPPGLYPSDPSRRYHLMVWESGVIDPITSVLLFPFAAILLFRLTDEDPVLLFVACSLRGWAMSEMC